MPGSEKGSSGPDALDALSFLTSGDVTVTVKGYPLFSIDSQRKVLEVELQGAREAGINLSKLIKLERPGAGAIRGSESIAKKLSLIGWRLTLYDRGDRVLSAGSGVSRLSGHLSFNPLKLKRLLDALK